MKNVKILKMIALVMLVFAVTIGCSSDDGPYIPDPGGNGGGNPPEKPKDDGFIDWTYSINFFYSEKRGPISDYLLAFEISREDAFKDIQSKEELDKIGWQTQNRMIRSNMYLEIETITNYGDTLIINTADEEFDLSFYSVKDRGDRLLYLITIQEFGGQTPSDPTAGGSGSPAVKAEKVTAEGYWVSQKTGNEILFAENPDPEMSYR